MGGKGEKRKGKKGREEKKGDLMHFEFWTLAAMHMSKQRTYI